MLRGKCDFEFTSHKREFGNPVQTPYFFLIRGVHSKIDSYIPAHAAISGRMKHVILSFLALFAVNCQAELSKETIESFKAFAARDLFNFGAARGTSVTLEKSSLGFSIHVGGEEIGSSETYERCLGKLEKGDLKLSCYEGITAAMDLCKIKPKPSVCQGEVRQKVREIYLDPNPSNGETMRGLGRQKTNPYIHSVTALAKTYPAARKAIAKAMEINGCESVELGDVEGQALYLNQQALADEDTEQLYDNAVNRYRVTLKCRTDTVGVYLDVVKAVVQGKVKQSLVPIRAAEEPEFVLDIVEPDFGSAKRAAAK